MHEAIVRSSHYVLKISNAKIQPGDYVIGYDEYSLKSLPRRVMHQFTVDGLLKNKRKIVAHKPLNDSPVLEGVPLLEDNIYEDF